MKKWIIAGCLLFIFADCCAQKVKGSMFKLPLVILPAPPDKDMPLVLSITGDGGWVGFDRTLAKQFTGEKVPVVALNSFRFFLKKKTPEQTTAVIIALLHHYMKQMDRNSFILEGYSFGADVVPFVFNRLPPDLLQQCRGVALFSPGTTTDFKIRLLQMMGTRHKWKYNVVSEIKAMKPFHTLFFFGLKEHKFPLHIISKPGWQLIYLKGGHTYKKEKGDVAKIVLKKLGFE